MSFVHFYATTHAMRPVQGTAPDLTPGSTTTRLDGTSPEMCCKWAFDLCHRFQLDTIFYVSHRVSSFATGFGFYLNCTTFPDRQLRVRVNDSYFNLSGSFALLEGFIYQLPGMRPWGSRRSREVFWKRQARRIYFDRANRVLLDSRGLWKDLGHDLNNFAANQWFFMIAHNFAS